MSEKERYMFSVAPPCQPHYKGGKDESFQSDLVTVEGRYQTPLNI